MICIYVVLSIYVYMVYVSLLRQLSVSKFTSDLSNSTSTDQKVLRQKTVHSSSLTGDLSSQWLCKCSTVEELTFTPDKLQVLLARRTMVPTHTYTSGSKCPCGKLLGDSGNHTSSFCSKDKSLHVVHSTVLRAVDKAARSEGLSTTL